MKTTLALCPVCDHPLTITRLTCDNCSTVIEGAFPSSPGPFAQLTPEQSDFALAFIRCEGRMNRLQEELNQSYPTLRNRLSELVRALGFEPGKEEIAPRLTPADRARILDEINAGTLSTEAARRRLAGD